MTLFAELKIIVASILEGFGQPVFKRFDGDGFALLRGKGYNHNESSLVYREDGHEYEILTEVGVHGERYFSVENMGSLSFVLGIQPIEEKIRIARTIRDVLISQGFDCQVLYEDRPLDWRNSLENDAVSIQF